MTVGEDAVWFRKNKQNKNKQTNKKQCYIAVAILLIKETKKKNERKKKHCD